MLNLLSCQLPFFFTNSRWFRSNFFALRVSSGLLALSSGSLGAVGKKFHKSTCFPGLYMGFINSKIFFNPQFARKHFSSSKRSQCQFSKSKDYTSTLRYEDSCSSPPARSFLWRTFPAANTNSLVYFCLSNAWQKDVWRITILVF